MLSNTEYLDHLQAAAHVVNITEVFVDGFIAATNDRSKAHLAHFSQAMLMGVHSVFPPPSESGHYREDPVPQKKLYQGEGTWSTQKEILGWIVDSTNFTIQLCPSKCNKMATELTYISKLKYVGIHMYQKLHCASGMLPLVYQEDMDYSH